MMTTNSLPAAGRRTLDLTYSAMFAVLMAVCSWISTPPTPLTVPFTLQTFGLFAAFTMLGGRRGTWAVAVYLLMGLVGLPVFSGFQGGAGVLLGATGGYIVGFLAAGLVYWLVTAMLGERTPAMVLGCLLGMGTYYAFGTAWFLVMYSRSTGPIGLSAALGWCVVPFIVPDLIKLSLAVALSGRVKRLIKR